MDNQQQIDQDALNLAKAIRQKESGGDFSAKGTSGEIGAYQFMPNTWKGWSKQYLGSEIPLEKATPEQQNAVAYRKIKELKDSGKDVAQIAAIWNSGSDKDWTTKVGTTPKGISYNVPGYVNDVAKIYQKIKTGTFAETGPQAISQGASQVITGQGEGGRVGGILKTAGGLLDTISKPFVDIAAMPMQAGIAGLNKLTGSNIQDPFSTGEGYGIVAKERLSPITDISGKAKSALGVAAETAGAIGAGKLVRLATGAKALSDPAIETAMSKFKMPMAEFNTLSKTEKLNALGEALKTAPAGDALKIVNAMDKLAPRSGLLKTVLSKGWGAMKGYAIYNLFGQKIGSIIDSMTDK